MALFQARILYFARSMDRLRFGLEMEEQAFQWLAKSQPVWSLAARNYRWKGGEIDLVYEDPISRTLIFIEVRSRKTGALVSAIESITQPKIRRLSRTIEHFLTRYQGSAKNIRLDVLAWDGKEWAHLKNILTTGKF